MKVYAKLDGDIITAVKNEQSLTDITGWTLIGEGKGDRYRHPEGYFLPKPITDENGVFRYKLAAGEIVERTPEERAADVEEAPAETVDRLTQLIDDLSSATTLSQIRSRATALKEASE